MNNVNAPVHLRGHFNRHIAPNGAGRSGTLCGGDTMPRLTPPTTTTLLISLILAVVAVAGQYVHQISNYIPMSMFWLAVVAYIVLLLGNVIRGL